MIFGYREALRAPRISSEEENRLVSCWQESRCFASIDALIRSHARIAFSVARMWTRDEVRISDLAQDGMIGIVRAADAFRPEKNMRFAGYARMWIKSGIAAAAPQVISVIDVPPRLWQDVRNGKVVGRERERLMGTMWGGISFDAPVGDGDETVGDVFPCGMPGPDRMAQNASLGRRLKSSIDRALCELPVDQAQVFRRRRLLDEPDTLEDIGADMAVSREHVRRLEMRAMAHVKRTLSQEGFAQELAA